MNFPSFDKELLLYVNGCNNVLLDGVMQRFSDTWTWSLLAAVAIFVILKDRPIKEALMILFGVVLCILLADQISSSLIKPWVARFRPTHDPEIMHQVRCIVGRGGMYGFVSSHAANTFAVATFLSLVFRHGITSLCLILWATVVSISRVYLAMHFPLDITAGALLGVLVGAVVYGMFVFASNRLSGTQQQYYSSAYTNSGFLCDDMHIILTAMALTLAYTLF